jgi:hypothetical protein
MTLWPVQSPAQWAQLAQLLQAYAAKDLDQAHLSTIWQDLQDLPARYGGPQGGAVLMTNETGGNYFPSDVRWNKIKILENAFSSWAKHHSVECDLSDNVHRPAGLYRRQVLPRGRHSFG